MVKGLTTRIRDGAFRDIKFCFWNLKEFQLFMEGTSYCNLFDIASFLKNCPSLENLFIDVSIFNSTNCSNCDYVLRNIYSSALS